MVETEMRRVSIKAGPVQADVALPAEVPVAELIPSVYDILGETPSVLGACYLCRPGQPTLDASMSLSQQGIDDGALLLLVRGSAPRPSGPVVHAADAVEVAGSTPQPWTASQSRLAAVVFAVVLAGTAGWAVVPGEVSAPSLLLAAASATAAAAIGASVTRYGWTALLAVITTGVLVTGAAFSATVVDAPVGGMGAALTVMSVGVLSLPARLAVRVSGLSSYVSGDLDPDSDAVGDDVWVRSARAQHVLTALVVGASTAATIATAAVALAGDRELPNYLVTGVVAALLILRSRIYHHPIRRPALLLNGLLSVTMLLVGLRLGDPGVTSWVCGTATLLAAGALWVGFAAHQAINAPPVSRVVGLLDCVLVVAVIPLACWSFGAYEAVRGMSL
jgi:type VII secretion integral membrane protein EccD